MGTKWTHSKPRKSIGKVLGPRIPIQIRWFSKIKIGGIDECWEWIGPKNKKGYGEFRALSKFDRRNYFCKKNGSIAAHRLSWIICNREEIPNGMQVMHACDNRENVLDSKQKGRRFAYLARKLNDEQVREIRRMYIPYSKDFNMQKLADKFGIHNSEVCHLLKKTHYADVK